MYKHKIIYQLGNQIYALLNMFYYYYIHFYYWYILIAEVISTIRNVSTEEKCPIPLKKGEVGLCYI